MDTTIMNQLSNNEVAVLAGYVMVRLSKTTIKRNDRDLPFLMLWDKNQDRLKWAQAVLQRHMPGSKPVNMTWQDDKKQGVIQFSGARAGQFLRLIQPYLEKTPMCHLVQ